MSQLFKNPYPIEKLKEYILKLCEPGEKHNTYVLTKISFRRAHLAGNVVDFLVNVAPYYHKSKQKYADISEIAYRPTATVLRQLCKFHNIAVESNIKYDKSSYEIEYFIKLTDQEPSQNSETQPTHHSESEPLTDGQTICTCCGLKYPSQE
jgi:hypothetical protein